MIRKAALFIPKDVGEEEIKESFAAAGIQPLSVSLGIFFGPTLLSELTSDMSDDFQSYSNYRLAIMELTVPDFQAAIPQSVVIRGKKIRVELPFYEKI